MPRVKNKKQTSKTGKAATQYTIRGVPETVDQALRQKAKREGRSLNEVAVEALERGSGVAEEKIYHDLDFAIGTWQEDPEFDRIIAEQDQVDESAWR